MTYDVPGATAFKEQQDAKIADLEAQAAALTGKDNKKARQEKDKEKAELKNSKECCVPSSMLSWAATLPRLFPLSWFAACSWALACSGDRETTYCPVRHSMAHHPAA